MLPIAVRVALGASAGPGSAPRRAWRPRSEVIAAYLCIAPWLIGLLGLQVGPMLLSLAVSFTDYAVLRPDVTRGVGLDNYLEAVLRDDSVRQALRVGIEYAVLAVSLVWRSACHSGFC